MKPEEDFNLETNLNELVQGLLPLVKVLVIFAGDIGSTKFKPCYNV